MVESDRENIDSCRPIVRVKNISVHLGFRQVLNNISFDLAAGSVLAILGPNAAGKTTLLRTLAGAITPDQGEIEVSTDLSSPSATGWVGHQSFLYDELTVHENLRFWADLQNVKKANRRVDELIDQFGLGLFADERIDTLSFGTVRRVSICRSLLCEPQLLLLDEAFNGLDQTGIDHLLGLINFYKKSYGAVILTSHQVSLGLGVATDLLVLNNGRSILNGNIDRFDRQALDTDYLAYAKKISSETLARGQ
jgi:heme ABC exporter ATP-binding subunit CcmA